MLRRIAALNTGQALVFSPTALVEFGKKDDSIEVIKKLNDGCFRTTTTAIAKAEASIQTIEQRQCERLAKFWIKLQTLPPNHPLARMNPQPSARYLSPLWKLGRGMRKAAKGGIAKVRPFAFALWEKRLRVRLAEHKEEVERWENSSYWILVATATSARGRTGEPRLVGFGVGST